MNAVTGSSDFIQIVLAILATGYTIYFVKNVMYRTRMQVEYENAFLDHYETEIARQQRQQNVNDYIQLRFERRGYHSLRSLCRQCRSKWSPGRYIMPYEPRIEVHYLRLRRLAVARQPIRVEVIVCNEMYALVDAGDGLSGYILQIDNEANKYNNIKMFHMYMKFQYKLKPADSVPPIDESISRHDLIS